MTNRDAQKKLAAYRDSIEPLRDRQSQLQDIRAVLERVAPETPETNANFTSEDRNLQLQCQFELVTAALIGGLTNVAVISAGAGGKFDLSYPSLVPEMTRHGLHHNASNDETLVSYILSLIHI